MPRDLSLIDTNVLVYALITEAPQHARSRALVEKCLDPEAGLCITAQIVAEFYAIVTSPKRVSSARPPMDTLAAIRAMIAMPGLMVLPAPLDVVDRLLDLLAQGSVTGQHVHDAHIAAVALASGVRRVFTFNGGDFKSFAGLEIIEP